MAFWSTNFGESSTLKDPKRNFRFIVRLNGVVPDGGQLWYASTCGKPAFSITSAEHKYLNHTFYYPGNVAWQEVVMTLVDPVDPDVTATLADIIVNSGYAPPTDPNALGTISKARAANSLGTVSIIQLDSFGAYLEEWTLMNAYIQDIKFSDLSYGDEKLTETTLTLKYDWASVVVAAGSKGSAAVVGEGTKEFFKA